MQIDLTDEELILLRDLLDHTYAELREEAHRTDAAAWKSALKDRERAIGNLIAKLRATQ